jgi:hypothetical protein
MVKKIVSKTDDLFLLLELTTSLKVLCITMKCTFIFPPMSLIQVIEYLKKMNICFQRSKSRHSAKLMF